MNRIYVYSKSPVTDCEECVLATETSVGRNRLRYTLLLEPGCEDGVRRAKDFIYDALLQNIVADRLLRNGRMEIGTDRVFSQKLSAYLYITGSKSKIDSIVSPLLEDNDIINIDGLINFRLHELSNDISAFFDLMFYEYNIQKQYDDFISLVRDYIRLESPREAVIHVVFGKDGFLLYNTEKVNITSTAMEKYIKDSSCSEGSLNDFLISSLLYFLPKEIVIHTGDCLRKKHGAADKRIIDTINTIFKESVKTCGCNGCAFSGEVLPEDFPNYTVCDDILF